MSDGAHQGINSEDALGVILGGDDAEDKEQITPEQMLAKIRGQGFDGSFSYDGCSTATARLILEAYEKYPDIKKVSNERTYLLDGEGRMVWPAVHLDVDLHSVLKELYADDPQKLAVLSDLTGFMWGWAVNAVKFATGAPPVPNPAIVEVG